MRWFIGLCSVVALLGVGSLTARPAVADKLPAIVFAHPEPFIVDDPEQDAAAKLVMMKGFALRMAALAADSLGSGPPGWECVGVGASGPPMVELSFIAQKSPEEFGDKHYLLTLSLFVRDMGLKDLGVRSGYADAQVTIDLNDPAFAEEAKSDDPVIILREWGKALIRGLMEKFKPCALNIDIMVKQTVRYDDQYAVINTETSMAPVELELMLDENGAFAAAEGHAAMQFTGTIAPGPAMLALRSLPSPPPPCVFETVRLSGQQSLTLSAAGTYRDDDASLLYDSITATETGPAKLTSTGGCAAGMVPPEIETGMAGDLLGSGERAQPLENGAVLALPRADFMPPEVSWEGSVTLTYEPKVGGTPPTQPVE
jgi:hypothetical protein